MIGITSFDRRRIARQLINETKDPEQKSLYRKIMHKDWISNLDTTSKLFYTIGYTLTLLVIICITDFLLNYFMNTILFPMLDWFNHRGLFVKIVLFLIGVTGIFSVLMRIFRATVGLITVYIFDRFPSTILNNLISLVLGLLNTILCTVKLWSAINNWNFWTIIEFIALCIFVLFINVVFMIKATPEEFKSFAPTDTE